MANSILMIGSFDTKAEEYAFLRERIAARGHRVLAVNTGVMGTTDRFPVDVEAQVFDWGRLSWLSEPRVTATERFSAGVVTLEPGKGHDRHNHPGVEEILYVLVGTGVQTVDRPEGRLQREVGPGVLIHIPPDVFHSTVNSGDGPMRLLAVYAPPGPEAELREMDSAVIEPAARG